LADDGSCRNGGFPSVQSDFAVARVTGSGRLYLLGDMDGCPARGEPACRQRSYLVTSDKVVTGRVLDGYRCVFFPNRGGGSAGWVDAGRLQVVPLPAPALADWAGHWQDGDNTLELRLRDGRLQATGAAYWPSARTERPYGPHIGQINAQSVPHGRSVDFVDDDIDECRLHAQWLGEYLLVSDNTQCGGANVSFDGVYRRAPAR
jgi:hypothetical protein